MKKFFCVLLAFCFSFLLVSCNSTSKNKKNTSNNINSPWSPTIRFDTNGGSKVSPIKANVIEDAPKTTKTDHLFYGWYLDEYLTSPAIFPLTLEYDTTLYAKWLKVKARATCENTSIKMWANAEASQSWLITPVDFDLDLLALNGYSMEISVSYEVYYEKDYDILWDIGYAGSPKYEVYILSSNNTGVSKENLTTTTTPQQRTITYRAHIDNFKNQQIKLKFSTNNIQNIIHLQNIIITYTCFEQ